MATFYVGYGHKSIGDCGSTTIFVEGISMLAAKAIQDYRLYNGQEASTRYIDFATQTFIDPVGSAESHTILESWRSLYLEGIALLKEQLSQEYPCEEGEDPKSHIKAINARAFDIMRGFLPAGASTNLAWHTELRHAADHLMNLRHHPLAEVRLITEVIEEALIERFPSSFSTKRYEATEAYIESWMRDDYYFQGDDTYRGLDHVKLLHSGIRHDVLDHYRNALASRPPKTELPKFLAEAGSMTFAFLLDFGSFRDIQRHRAVIQRMPLLTADYGMSEWYLKRLPEDFRKKAVSVTEDLLKQIKNISQSPEVRQYYMPMGMQVPCRLTGDIPALVYLVELRSGIAVHATLRIVAQQTGPLMLEELGSHGLVLHLDMSEDRFNAKRGKDDIVEKTTQVS
ncbi:FAD-dependent thymidylate synthase [Candidatus Kaiserbacteria bacterium]|nr:FAD-dependent thymidylate synthase [Candidatus Kaiserbacteria bacterium]